MPTTKRLTYREVHLEATEINKIIQEMEAGWQKELAFYSSNDCDALYKVFENDFVLADEDLMYPYESNLHCMMFQDLTSDYYQDCISPLFSSSNNGNLKVYYKLLRHCLIHGDFRLVAELLVAPVAMMNGTIETCSDYNDDLSIVRHIVALFIAFYPEEFDTCNGFCTEDEEHVCEHVTQMKSAFEHLLVRLNNNSPFNILTTAWIFVELNQMSPSASSMENSMFLLEPSSSTNSGKDAQTASFSLLLKRRCHVANAESEEASDMQRLYLFRSVLLSYLVPFPGETDCLLEEYYYKQCRHLVFLGELFVRRFTETEECIYLATDLLHIFKILALRVREGQGNVVGNQQGVMGTEIMHRGSTDPHEFVYWITEGSGYNNLSFLKDIVDIIRSIFVCGMYSPRYSLQKYLTLNSYSELMYTLGEITHPEDPLLFHHPSNCLTEEDYDTEESDDESIMENEFFRFDENNRRMNIRECIASYDFALLNLLRVWNQSWTPTTHHSYSPSFRQSIYTIALCCHRAKLPQELFQNIVTFIPRNFWPNRNNTTVCWAPACMTKCSINQMKVKIIEEEIKYHREIYQIEPKALMSMKSKLERSVLQARNITPCTGCSIAHFCSDECKTITNKEGHRTICNRPPFRFGKREEMLCRLIFDSDSGEGGEMYAINDSVEDGSDHSSCWESIDSEEEEVSEENEEGNDGQVNRTKIIHDFFERESYRHVDIGYNS